jgi:hypothetical protein
MEKEIKEIKCNVSECFYNSDCMILSLTRKPPKNSKDCSYFTTPKDIVKSKKKSNAQSDN